MTQQCQNGVCSDGDGDDDENCVSPRHQHLSLTGTFGLSFRIAKNSGPRSVRNKHRSVIIGNRIRECQCVGLGDSLLWIASLLKISVFGESSLAKCILCSYPKPSRDFKYALIEWQHNLNSIKRRAFTIKNIKYSYIRAFQTHSQRILSISRALQDYFCEFTVHQHVRQMECLLVLMFLVVFKRRISFIILKYIISFRYSS